VRALQYVGLPVLAIVLNVAMILRAIHRHGLGLDFTHVSPAIRGLVHGADPYVIENVNEGGHFLWTILAGWILAPFAWLPHGYLLVVAFELVGMVLAALLLGLRDIRLIALSLAWPATLVSVQTGNITVLVAVLLAAAWHERGRSRAGIWAGLAVGVKLFAWPVLVWLVATRRWRALALALSVQVFTLLITLPYTSLGEYVRFERAVDHVMSGESITLAALVRQHGGSTRVGTAVALVVGLAVLWKGRRDLGWVVVAMLVLSPVVWLHYYGLLLIPLALWSPPLWVWSLPMLLFVGPGRDNGGPVRTALVLGVAAATVAAAWVWRKRGAVPAEAARGRRWSSGGLVLAGKAGSKRH
jgi:hypothetical protein